ncbi:MBL fold metallo-hydrolase [Paraclostridium sp. AKS73]|nr:MBL fold metallo-hydrolase [Paraclostridium sp. AKS73]
MKKAGYEPKDIDKVIVTHKHQDHTGELRLFDDSKIYIRNRSSINGLKG